MSLCKRLENTRESVLPQMLCVFVCVCVCVCKCVCLSGVCVCASVYAYLSGGERGAEEKQPPLNAFYSPSP
jgi:hypothetical protein